MSVVYRFHTPPAIKRIPPEVLKLFVGLQVPINMLEVVGTLGPDKSTITRRHTKSLEHDVIMTREAIVWAAFSQKRYSLGHFFSLPHVNVDTFVVDGSLVEEV